MTNLAVGQSFETQGRTVGESDINLFAGLVSDFTPIHVDETFAAASPHGTRIAHGPLTLAMSIGLGTLTGMFGDRVIGLVHLNWDFAGAVKLGDTIRARFTLEEARPTSNPSRNLETFGIEVVNQHGATVQRGQMKVLVHAPA